MSVLPLTREVISLDDMKVVNRFRTAIVTTVILTLRCCYCVTGTCVATTVKLALPLLLLCYSALAALRLLLLCYSLLLAVALLLLCYSLLLVLPLLLLSTTGTVIVTTVLCYSVPVSYTHLDVYKRQQRSQGVGHSLIIYQRALV